MSDNAPPIPEQYKNKSLSQRIKVAEDNGITLNGDVTHNKKHTEPAPIPEGRERNESSHGSRDFTAEVSPFAPQPPSAPRFPDARSQPSAPSRAAPAPVPNELELLSIKHEQEGAAKPPEPRIDTTVSMNQLNDPSNSKSKSAAAKAKEKTSYALVQANKHFKEKHFLERALVGGLAVALVWITSLRVCEQIVDFFIRGPQVDTVVELANNTISNTLTEKDRYESCAERRYHECNQTFIASMKLAKKNSDKILAANEIKIDQYYSIKTNCSQEVAWATQVLDYLTTQKSVDVKAQYPTAKTNTDPKCSLIDQMIKGKNAALGTYQVASEYKDDSDSTVYILAKQVNARAAYDAEYLANKTGFAIDIGIDLNLNLPDINPPFVALNVSFDKLLACVSKTKTYNGQVCTNSALKRLDDLRKQAENSYTTLVDKATTWKDNAEGIINQAKAFYDALNLHDDWRDAIDAALGLVGSAFRLQPYWGSLSFSLPGTITLPSFSFNPPDIDLIFADYTANVAQYLEAIKNETLAILNQRNLLKLKNLDWQTHLFDDYNPPPVKANITVAEWNLTSQSFLPNIATSLDEVNTPDPTFNEQYISSVNDTSTVRTAKQYLSSVNPRSWDIIGYDISLDDLIDSWRGLRNFIVSADTAYRVIHTIQIIVKYWRVSAVTTPPADVRIQSQRGALQAPPRKTPAQATMYWITHPFVNLIIVVVFLVIIGGLVISIYKPFYDDFVKGCILHDRDSGNGTMITRNGYTMAYELSASSGDLVSSTGIDKINAQKEVECTANTDKSRNTQNDQDDEVTFIANEHEDMRYQWSALSECLDISAIDHDWDSSNVPFIATGGNITKLSHVTTEAIFCPIQFSPLPSGEYICPNVTNCDVRCSGPNAEVLASTVYNTGCTAEWYIHTALLASVMTAFVFICMNISRRFILRGLTRMMWRHLTHAKFSYIGTCTESGDLIYPDKVVKDKWSMRKTIEYELKKSIRSYERYGLFIVISSLAINIPWIVILNILYNTLSVRNE